MVRSVSASLIAVAVAIATAGSASASAAPAIAPATHVRASNPSVVVAAKPNLVLNGSAEFGTSAPIPGPRSWEPTGPAILSWAKPQAHGGRHSLRITATTPSDSAWTQTVHLAPNQLYRLTGWVKTAGVAHTAELVDAGANLSVVGTWDHTTAVVGTHGWTFVSLLVRAPADGLLTVGARLGYWAGTTTGTAWFDDIQLAPVVATPTAHPRWRLLVLVYDRTEVSLPASGGTTHPAVGVLSASDKAAIDAAARRFAGTDVPALTSGAMVPRLTIRHRPVAPLERTGDGYWPSPSTTAADRDPRFDAVIAVWQSNVVDSITGTKQWIGTAAGLTPGMGLASTYSTMISDAAFTYGHLNVWKHEFGHSLLFFFDAAGTTAQPAVDNHATATTYVHCRTAKPYVWVDETDAAPVPNSIYNNSSGFTHDYYSGTTALTGDPTHCLGISSAAWARGGPVSMTTRTLAPQARVLRETVAQLVDVHALTRARADVLRRELTRAAGALQAVRVGAAAGYLRSFVTTVHYDANRHWLTPSDARVLCQDAGVLLDQVSGS
jgi:hypothetical protein